MKNICYFLSGIIIILVSFLNLVMVNKLLSTTSLYFCLWGSLPWFLVVFFASISKNNTFLKVLAALTVFVGGIGIFGMVDVLYIHPDAQGGLVFLFFPLYQLMFLMAAMPLILFFTRNKA